MYNESRDDQHAAAVLNQRLFEVLASLVAFLLVFLLAPFGAQYLAKDPATTALFRIYGLIILANLIAESSTGLLQILDRFRHLSALGIIQSVVTLALIGVVYFVQGGLLGYWSPTWWVRRLAPGIFSDGNPGGYPSLGKGLVAGAIGAFVVQGA